MKLDYKALGGLLEFKYYSGNDVEELDDEEFELLKEEYNEKKAELDKLKEVIDKREPPKKKVKKQKTAKDILGDKEIPYEVRMKYIIDAYRKDQEKWGKLAEYAKHLEAEVIRLKEILIVNGYADSGVIGDSKTAKVIKEQKEKIQKLEGMLVHLKELKDASNRIKDLEYQVSNFPLRLYKARYFKEIIKGQEKYIEELQGLLDDNNITYYPMMPVNDIDINNIDKVVADTEAFLAMHKKESGEE